MQKKKENKFEYFLELVECQFIRHGVTNKKIFFNIIFLEYYLAAFSSWIPSSYENHCDIVHSKGFVQRKSKMSTGQVVIKLPFLNSPLNCYVYRWDKLQWGKYTVTFPNPHSLSIRRHKTEPDNDNLKRLLWKPAFLLVSSTCEVIHAVWFLYWDAHEFRRSAHEKCSANFTIFGEISCENGNILFRIAFAGSGSAPPLPLADTGLMA
jgi:hypothetical protein